MDIKEHILIINQMKIDKATKSEIESVTIQNVSMTYKTWRKKINQIGYIYVNNQFILSTESSTINNTNNQVQQAKNNDITLDTITKSDTNYTTKSNTIDNNSTNNTTKSDTMSTELEQMRKEMLELKEMIMNQQVLIDSNKISSEKNDTIHRSVRVSQSVLNDFVTLCKDNKIKQVNALNRALELFIQEYENNKLGGK